VQALPFDYYYYYWDFDFVAVDHVVRFVAVHCRSFAAVVVTAPSAIAFVAYVAF